MRRYFDIEGISTEHLVADRDAAVAAGAQVVLDSSTDALSVTWGGQGIVVAFRLNGDWRSPNV